MLSIHPYARQCLTKLKLPGPVQKQYSGISSKIDLTNSTNPHVGRVANYPDLYQTELKDLYLKHICPIELNLTPDNVLFTVGSVDGMELLLRGFAEPNEDTICLVEPTFPAYEHSCIIHNLIVRKASLLGENFDTVDIDLIRKINPKILFLCDPNNPTGTKLEPQTIRKICSVLDGFVVVDEAYIEFSKKPTCLKLLADYKNLIVLRTLSKAWGMASLRCGMVIADQLIIDTLRYVQCPFGLSGPAQEIMRERFLNPQLIFDSWHEIRQNRDRLVQQLRGLKNVSKIYKSESNFILVTLSNFDQCMMALTDQSIRVADCSHVIPNSIKVSIGLPEDNNELLNALSSSSFQ